MHDHRFMRTGCARCRAISRRAFVATILAAPALPVLALGEAPPLDGWLKQHPAVANALVFTFPVEGKLAWPAWPEARKAGLRAAYAGAWTGTAAPLADPPNNARSLIDTVQGVSFLSVADCWSLYCALAGNSLAAEIGRRVPWSITSYDSRALSALFDGNQTFVWRADPGDYELALHGVPAPPDLALRFLQAQKIVVANRRTTIANLLAWCRDHLYHFTGDTTVANVEKIWGYRGYPPASRVIAGTHSTQPNAKPAALHYTEGCWGTTAFLANVLRAINIPVMQRIVHDFNRIGNSVETHSIPVFVADGVAMTHGDDPYNRFTRLQPSFPIEALLIDEPTIDKWFPANQMPNAQSQANVGRAVAQASLTYLPLYLVGFYAQDMLANRSHEDGALLKDISRYYSLAELDAANLWARLDQRVAELGGADKIRGLMAAAQKASDALESDPNAGAPAAH